METTVNSETIRQYRSVPADDDRGVDRWPTANAVIASLFAAAFAGLAVASLDPTPSPASRAQATDIALSKHPAHNRTSATRDADPWRHGWIRAPRQPDMTATCFACD